MNAEDGLEKLLNCLDEAFKSEKSDEEYHNYCKFTNFQRKSEQSMKDFLIEFDHLYYKMSGTNDGMKMADNILAFKCLDAAGVFFRWYYNYGKLNYISLFLIKLRNKK